MQNEATEAGFRGDPRLAEYPGTYIRDWVMLCRDVPDSAFRAYCLIRAHIWEKDVDRTVVLTQAQIAEMTGKSEERTRKVLKPLIAVGLLSIAQKRQWWEYNPVTKRQERRTMNVYAVTDFPPAGYEGARSLKDFGLRFAGAQTSSNTDRSETTDREAGSISAGQTDRSETTGKASPQVSDVSAGQTDRLKTASAAVKNDRPYKKPFQEEGEGEEGARPRASDPSSSDQTETDDHGWGVAPAPAAAASEQGGTLFARTVLADIATRTGLGLADWQHRRLATEHMPAALEAVRELGDPAITGTELCAWVAQGHEDTRSLYAVLSRRLAPDYLRTALPDWVARQQRAQGGSAPHAPAPAPRPRTGDDSRGGSEDDGDPWQRPASAGRCLVHRLDLTGDGRCLDCEREADPVQRPDDGEGQDAEGAAPESDQAPAAAALGAFAAGGTLPPAPWCGRRECNETTRTVVIWQDEVPVERVPCPQCGQGAAAAA